jgi:hypothetical protein
MAIQRVHLTYFYCAAYVLYLLWSKFVSMQRLLIAVNNLFAFRFIFNCFLHSFEKVGVENLIYFLFIAA